MRALYYIALLLVSLLAPEPLSFFQTNNGAIVSAIYNSGYWYGGNRGPRTEYDSVPFSKMTVKVLASANEGPGDYLVRDPFQPEIELYTGNTINRQTFDTQFILDMERAIGINADRIYVTGVEKGDVHSSWESTVVIVSFIFLERTSDDQPTLLQAVETLTEQIQLPDSSLYTSANVTNDIDSSWGLEVKTWDVSLQLGYAIEIIGGDAVQDGYYLNQGSLGSCNTDDAANYSTYCEFERFFEDDVSRALNISFYRVQVLFVKVAARDRVLVHFRIMPAAGDTGIVELDVLQSVAELGVQVADDSSQLYLGNVTIRTDSTWGVSQYGDTPTLRSREAKYTLQYYEYDNSRINSSRVELATPYDRCKANRRCNWGITEHDQFTNDVKFYHRLFERGTLYKTSLFLDFEDWRLGTRGFSWDGAIPASAKGMTSIPKARALDGTIRGAHFWPFDQPSLGPDIPCFHSERNQGLILDRILHTSQIDKQELLIDDLEGRIGWITTNIENATMGPALRSRKDVRSNLTWVRGDYNHWKENEKQELQELSSSQCVEFERCYIRFDTSTLLLTGAITGTGELKQTASGTEVALFTFNSVYLGPETEVILVGQRAFALLSKTSMIINTTIQSQPGTNGGFPGGGSVARYPNDMLSDTPRSIMICDLSNTCRVDSSEFTEEEHTNITSNNVNGPGSGNLRVNTFNIETSATYIAEIQTVTTSASAGQTLGGTFRLSFKGYETSPIPNNVQASTLKQIIEQNLNLVSPTTNIPADRTDPINNPAGVGEIRVARSNMDSTGGYTWTIRFMKAIGNIDLLVVSDNSLTGGGANVVTNTHTDGNELGGTFTLSFQGYETEPISYRETAVGLQAILAKMPLLTTVEVTRVDPTSNCDDGLCVNGPRPSRGLLWTVHVTTNYTYDDVTPFAPTDPEALTEAYFYRFTANVTLLTGIDAVLEITPSTYKSDYETPKEVLTHPDPFSLAFGGMGATYGGVGGKGYGINPVALTYNDDYISDLLGGSGGAMRLTEPFTINAIQGPVEGRGGHGGGAIELVAPNDVTIGSFGKILCDGGPGEGTAEGGGGGGSGGAIVITSGTSVIIDGSLSVRGGSGAYGGVEGAALAGGGGGAGRIAVYAESITINREIERSGGECGIKTEPVAVRVLELNTTILVGLILPLDNDRLASVTIEFIKASIDTLFINVTSVEQQSVSNGVILALLRFVITQDITDLGDVTQLQPTNYTDVVNEAQASFNANTGMDIAKIVILNATIDNYRNNTINPVLPIKVIQCDNAGGEGTLYTEAKMTTGMYIPSGPYAEGGAEGTKRALFLSNRETSITSSGSEREAPFSWNGPIVPFEPSRPTRISYYTKTDFVPGESLKADYGSLFSLLSRGESGLNISSVIGVYFGKTVMHGANFGSAVDEEQFLKRMVTISNYPISDRWYKIDIRIQWENHTYSVLIDDTVATSLQPFKGDDLDGIRLSVFRSVDVWFDEIYVGFDNTMEFTCPVTLRTGTTTSAPEQRHWSFEEVHGGDSEGYTEYYKMTRHYNFLKHEGYIPFDGNGVTRDFQDIKLDYPSGDYPITQGEVHAGALVYLTNSPRTGKTSLDSSKTLVSQKGLWDGAKDGPGGAGDGRQFWFTEYNYDSDISNTLSGGVAACSSQDLVSWRFEGIVIHYTNLSDMVYGGDEPLYLERPKVQYNEPTQMYVMWATLDNGNRSLAMSAIATSPYEDGPYLFRRSFYPDGNETRDQVTFLNQEREGILGRTFYQNVEFLQPERVMMPSWESAKGKDGSINYRSNYHRAFYSIQYDNFNDIYNQRWRKEDIEYDVVCENKETGARRQVEAGVFTEEGFICEDPVERKIVLGTGIAPEGRDIIVSRFVSPDNPENSWWRPTSVPNVEAQAWSNNYRDGYCGIRKLNDDFVIENGKNSSFDPALDDFIPEDRSTCSNIADNPVHESMADKLIGVLEVVLTRRAKFIALSELTYDYLDTTGALDSFEGELESGDLISMIVEMGQFGFGYGTKIKSTFRAQERSEFTTKSDHRTRFSQFIKNVNDRGTYSLACVIDGVCPVNFRDQLTQGHT